MTRILPRVSLALLAVCIAVPAQARRSNMATGDYIAAHVASLRGEHDRAAELLNAVRRHRPRDPRVLGNLVLSHVAAGQVQEALRLSRSLAAADSQSLFAQLLLGVAALSRHNHDAALKHFDTLAEQHPSWPGALLLAAWAAHAENRPADAHAYLDRARQSGVFPQITNFHAAVLHDLHGATDAATRAFDQSMRRGATTAAGRAITVFGRFLERNGKPEQARPLYAALLKGGQIEIAAGRAEQKRLDAGQPPRRLIRNARDGAAECLYHLALAAMLNRSREEALFYYNLALYLRRNLAEARIHLAGHLYSSEKFEAARAQYEKIPPNSPLHLPAQIQIARGFEKTGKESQAVRVLEKLAARHPNDTFALSTLGEIYQNRKDFEPSAQAFTRAIDRIDPGDPAHWTLFYARGIAYERLGKWPPAETDFKRALTLSGEHPLVLNYLGYSWVEQERYLSRALDMLKRAVGKRPDSGFIVDSLGWAHYRLGHYDDAVAYLERAVALEPGEAVINDHLGDAFWRTGRKIEARYQWARALQLKPDEQKRVAELERKLLGGLGPPPQDQQNRRGADAGS